MEFYRIIIADDQPLHRESLEKTLTRVLPSATVFNASKGEQVLEILSKAIIDLIFMKFPMYGNDGFQTALDIRKTNPDIKIIAITESDDKPTIEKLFRAGVNGYIHKTIDKQGLQSAIAAMSNGEIFVPQLFKNESAL